MNFVLWKDYINIKSMNPLFITSALYNMKCILYVSSSKQKLQLNFNQRLKAVVTSILLHRIAGRIHITSKCVRHGMKSYYNRSLATNFRDVQWLGVFITAGHATEWKRGSLHFLWRWNWLFGQTVSLCAIFVPRTGSSNFLALWDLMFSRWRNLKSRTYVMDYV